MNACPRHAFTSFFRVDFYATPGAAWAVEYCRCGARRDHAVNPITGPITEDQPTHVTHAVLKP